MNRTGAQGEKRLIGPAGAMMLVAGIVFLLLLPFLPLLLAAVENLTMGTNHVEEFCRQIGIHDELSVIYEPVIEFLGIK